MSDPTDPDTEDRRPERDREPEPDERDAYDIEDDRLQETASSQLGLVDDDEDLFEYALDDLKDMEGPDA
ncbi:MAG: hypothetical protein H0V17_08005 [Deltaproteobacteria bacterium]|nr:hypothetical protein [Deltaproteobacteria bacterium]